jgi:hypothetical protein
VNIAANIQQNRQYTPKFLHFLKNIFVFIWWHVGEAYFTTNIRQISHLLTHKFAPTFNFA